MKKIITFFIAFMMMITLTACGSSSASGKEKPEYYGTYEITGFVINGSEVSEDMAGQIKAELEKQGSYFTVTFGDKNYLTNNGKDYVFDVVSAKSFSYKQASRFPQQYQRYCSHDRTDDYGGESVSPYDTEDIGCEHAEHCDEHAADGCRVFQQNCEVARIFRFSNISAKRLVAF